MRLAIAAPPTMKRPSDGTDAKATKPKLGISSSGKYRPNGITSAGSGKIFELAKTAKFVGSKSSSGKTRPTATEKGKGFTSDGNGDNLQPKKAIAYDRKGRKEVTEIRKRKRKPHYDTEKEVVALWEKIRQRNIEKEDRRKLITKILIKMKGKLVEMAVNHIMARALQTCLKNCTSAERDAVYEELRPQCLALAKDKYASHTVIKMLDSANKAQLQQILSLLHGNVVALLRHPYASPVVEHAYTLANAGQKLELLSEFYSPEFRLFKGLNTPGKGKLLEYFASEPAVKRRAILEHMTLSLQPILEKGIVDHTIIHRAIVEYLSVSKKSMIEEIVQQLSGGLLVRMMHTKDGAMIGVTCLMYGNNKERKKIVKGMKTHVMKIACDDHGYMVLLALLDVVDDTKIVNKFIIKELSKDLKNLALHKYGSRVLLHLLAPRVPRYFTQEVRAALEPPSTNSIDDTESAEDDQEIQDTPATAISGSTKAVGEAEPMDEDNDDDEDADGEGGSGISRKDPSVRRFQLLVQSGLAKELAEVCRLHAKEMLQSQWGTDVIYELAMGGVNGELWQSIPGAMTSLYKEIANLATKEKSEEENDEHIMEQMFSSRTLKRLILDSKPPPEGVEGQSFSAVFWSIALKKKCKFWARDHSEKVVSAYRNCGDLATRKSAKAEIQALVDSGVLRPETAKQQNGQRSQ